MAFIARLLWVAPPSSGLAGVLTITCKQSLCRNPVARLAQARSSLNVPVCGGVDRGDQKRVRDRIHIHSLHTRNAAMRMEVHVHADIPILEGVARKQLETALSPWLDYLDADSIDDVKSLEPEEPGIEYD